MASLTYVTHTIPWPRHPALLRCQVHRSFTVIGFHPAQDLPSFVTVRLQLQRPTGSSLEISVLRVASRSGKGDWVSAFVLQRRPTATKGIGRSMFFMLDSWISTYIMEPFEVWKWSYRMEVITIVFLLITKLLVFRLVRSVILAPKLSFRNKNMTCHSFG